MSLVFWLYQMHLTLSSKVKYHACVSLIRLKLPSIRSTSVWRTRIDVGLRGCARDLIRKEVVFLLLCTREVACFQLLHFSFLPLPLSFLFLDYSIIHVAFLLSSLLVSSCVPCYLYGERNRRLPPHAPMLPCCSESYFFFFL